jgi:hypothetical protein
VRRRSIIIAACVLLVVALGLVGWSFAGKTNWHGDDEERAGAAITAADLASITAKSGLALPAGTRGVHYQWVASRSIDPSMFAKVEVPAETEAALRAAIGALPDHRISVSGESRPAWWRPSEGTVLVERVFADKSACLVHIVLCKEGSVLVVYVEWAQI